MRSSSASGLLLALGVASSAGGDVTFRVSFAPGIDSAYTGRVYVMLTARSEEPRRGPAWFGTEPFYAIEVEAWAPDEAITFADPPYAFPAPLSELPTGTWRAQAILRRNPDAPALGTAPGTAYSDAVVFTNRGGDASVELRIDRVVPPADDAALETDLLKIVAIRSRLLSAFHGRDITLRAAVALPEGHGAAPERRYPAIYLIPGFGGDHHDALRMARGRGGAPPRSDVVWIGLDAQCATGHHAFADSANNGPYGRALVEELIPHLEATFPLAANREGRFLAGVSSGGWSSLWLQVTCPDVFGATWSLVPDPVDFRDFQRIDIYAPGANVYRDEYGRRRPIARRRGRVAAWFDAFAAMEVVMGRGGQLGSFDAVFGPRGEDGLPARLFDADTGAVDPAVAEHWRAYDIRLILEERWPELGPKLAGRLNVFAGADDDFYLEGAVALLARSLEALGSDAVVEVLPGRTHGTVADRAMWRRIEREALARFGAEPG